MRVTIFLSKLFLALLFSAWGAATLSADELPIAKPAEVGMSATELSKIRPALDQFVDSGQLSGWVVAVARQGKQIYLEAGGARDLEAKEPKRRAMTLDTIHRIYSMSKPVTSVAVMMLVEEGSIDLDAPLERYLKRFKGVEVLLEVEADAAEVTSPPNRRITVRDLLRHTSGMTYGFFGDTAVDRKYRELDVLARDSTLGDMIDKITRTPLLYEPGTRWHYSVATDVCGHLVEVVSKQSFAEFLKTRIFDPLDMKDTAFFVPDEKIDRFANNYSPKSDGPGLRVIDTAHKSRYRKPPKLASGGGGLVSTARDYLRFCQMLLNRGELDGKRILRHETVEAMTHNQLTGSTYPIRFGLPQKGIGFGLGFSVIVTSTGPATPVGEYGWSGAASTHFWISPDHQLAVVVMTQFMPFSVLPAAAVRPWVYRAIEKGSDNNSDVKEDSSEKNRIDKGL